VFDLQGSVIGIATFQFRSGQNLNFAVPAETIRELLPRNENLSLAAFRKLVHKQPAHGEEPDEFELAMSRAASHAAKEDYIEALHWLRRAQRLRPTDANAYYSAAQCYDRLSQRSSAAAEYYAFLKFARETDERRQQAREWLAGHGFPVPE
jgi:Flp pilus assembly protein TadD